MENKSAADLICDVVERTKIVNHPETTGTDRERAMQEIGDLQAQAEQRLGLSIPINLEGELRADPAKWADRMISNPGFYRKLANNHPGSDRGNDREPLLDAKGSRRVEQALDRLQHQNRTAGKHNPEVPQQEAPEQSGVFAGLGRQLVKDRGAREGAEIRKLRSELTQDRTGGPIEMDRNTADILVRRIQHMQTALFRTGEALKLVKPEMVSRMSETTLNSADLKKMTDSVVNKTKEVTSALRTQSEIMTMHAGALRLMGRDMGIWDTNETGMTPLDNAELNALHNSVCETKETADQLQAENTAMKDRLAGLAERLGDTPEGRELQSILADAGTASQATPSEAPTTNPVANPVKALQEQLDQGATIEDLPQLWAYVPRNLTKDYLVTMERQSPAPEGYDERNITEDVVTMKFNGTDQHMKSFAQQFDELASKTDDRSERFALSVSRNQAIGNILEQMAKTELTRQAQENPELFTPHSPDDEPEGPRLG
ncbi:MAG: hypothetical protein AWU57_344 [Marinobacter sp. T13-3]|nr:MAG: hypothetical protein AWU57_344 [Marinobacter sp. T13-3]